MYEKFFGLRERPFDLTPDTWFLFLTPKHREALGNLEYGLCDRTGITLLTGEAGTGKTTLLHAALEASPDRNVLAVSLRNPTLTKTEFFEFLALRSGLSKKAASSKARFLFELTNLLSDRQRSEKRHRTPDHTQPCAEHHA